MELKLIDVKALKQKIMKTYLPSDSLTAGVLYDLISLATPIVDAVPVVRCGRCKHYRDGRCYRDGYEYDKWASGDTSERPKNAPVYYGLKATDFCSHGEPRTPPAE